MTKKKEEIKDANIVEEKTRKNNEALNKEVEQETEQEVEETEKKKDSFKWKRFFAYMLDFFLATLVVSVISEISFLNPNYDADAELRNKYSNTVNEKMSLTYKLAADYSEDKELSEAEYDELIKISEDYGSTYAYLLVEKYDDKVLTEEEYNSIIDTLSNVDDIKDLYYASEKTYTLYYIEYIIIFILYFVVFNVITKGQTLFKKMLGLKITNDKDDVKWYSYLIRCILLYGLFFDLIKIIIILTINDSTTFYNVSSVLSNIQSIYQMIFILFLFLNKNNLGIHDYAARTKVINTRN